MKNMPETELLSAYLDGELTAEEQAEVEQLLAASPEARQLLEDLRALSSSLGALPSHKIGQDISEQVLRRAQRQVFSEPEAVPPGREKPPQPVVPVWRAVVRRVARPRTLVWSGVAVAVALLLMVMESETLLGPGNQRVAYDPDLEVDRYEAAPRAAPSIQASEESAREMFTEAPASTELQLGDAPAGRPGLVIGKGGAPEATAADSDRAVVPAAPRRALTVESLSGAWPAAEAPAKAKGTGSGYGGRYDVAGGRRIAGDVARKYGPPEAPPVAGKRAGEDYSRIAARKASPAASAARVESLAERKADQPRRPVQQPEMLLVVSCDVTGETLREGVFEDLVQKQQIALDVVDGQARLRSLAATGKLRADDLKLHVLAEQPAGSLLQLDLEATPDQIKGLLADLQQRPKEFSSLSCMVALGAVSPGFGRSEANGRIARRRVALPSYQYVEALAEAGAKAAQQQLNRIELEEVAKLLDLAQSPQPREQVQRYLQMRNRLGIAAQAADVTVQEVIRPADSPRAGEITLEKLEAPAERARAFPGARTFAAPRQSAQSLGAGMQPAMTPQVVPSPKVLTKAADEETAETMRLQAPKLQPEKPRAEPLANEGPPPPKDRRERERRRRAGGDAADSKRGLGRALAEPAPRRDKELDLSPEEEQQPAPSAESEPLDRDAARYRVQLLFRVVEPRRANVPASVADEARPARAVLDAHLETEDEAAAPAAEAAQEAKPPGVEP